MKIFLRGLKLFIAFFALFFAVLLIWETRKTDVPDKGLLIVAACLSIGVTILWMECKKE